jgi:hypothetical protein
LEEEGPLLRATQTVAPPPRIPLDLRLTEEEFRLRETRTVLERLSNVVADIVEDENLNAAVDLIKDKLDEDEASEQKTVRLKALPQKKMKLRRIPSLT